MAQVEADIEEVVLENDRGIEVDGVVATCRRCGHSAECFGQTDRSRKRALMMLRDDCPEGGENFYVDAEE